MSAYWTQTSLLKYLPLPKREELVRQFLELRTRDNKTGHRFKLVLVEKFGDGYFLQLDNLLVKIEQVQWNRQIMIYYRIGDPLRVAVQRVDDLHFLQPHVLFPNNAHVMTVPRSRATTIDGAARLWLANYLDRPDTVIGRLVLQNVAADFCAGFRVGKCDILDLREARAAGNSSLLIEDSLVKMVQCGEANMLQNQTVRAAQIAKIPRLYAGTSPQTLMRMNGQLLKIGWLLQLEFIMAFSREIAEHGKPLGYKCTSYTHGNMDYGTLEWLGVQMRARKTQLLGKICITLEIISDPTLELNLRTDPQDSYILWIEVAPKGTAANRN